MSDCPRCPALAETIRRQQAEIHRLKTIIRAARLYADTVAGEADKAISRGGLTRYQFNQVIGARNTARQIRKVLGG